MEIPFKLLGINGKVESYYFNYYLSCLSEMKISYEIYEKILNFLQANGRFPDCKIVIDEIEEDK